MDHRNNHKKKWTVFSNGNLKNKSFNHDSFLNTPHKQDSAESTEKETVRVKKKKKVFGAYES